LKERPGVVGAEVDLAAAVDRGLAEGELRSLKKEWMSKGLACSLVAVGHDG
jgi:hypothetical protein